MDGPSFGVLPDRVRSVVEFDREGHRVLTVAYGEGLDSRYTMVQLRTPAVPALVITPKTGVEPFRPVEDARLTRNVVGAPRPEEVLRAFETGTDLDRRFDVTTTDPEFARAVLNEPVLAMLRSEPWFRVREVAFHLGALWTVESGRLSEDEVLVDARHLARLAAAVPWPAEDEAFREVLRTADTSEAAWHSGRGPLLRLNRRRVAVDRQPLSVRALVVRTVLVLALVLPVLPLVGNGLFALTGLAPEVALTVTSAIEGEADSTCSTCGSLDEVSGFYERDGVTHTVTKSHWMSFARLPDVGEVVRVSIGPFWWRPMIERADTAVLLVGLGLVPMLVGVRLGRATYLPRRRRRAGGESGRG